MLGYPVKPSKRAPSLTSPHRLLVSMKTNSTLTMVLHPIGCTTSNPRPSFSNFSVTLRPCMMPFITCQFLCRGKGDRPQVIPEGTKNLAFTGQFCELPDDVVFTVEYSIRSAQTAVYSLVGLNPKPPAVYKGEHDPRVLLKAFIALHEVGA